MIDYESASVYRLQRTTEAGRQSAAETLVATITCRCGPLDARTQVAVFGDFSSERLLIEWGEEALVEGDVIEFRGRRFVYSALRSDVYRPAWSIVPAYQTGALTLQKKARRD